MTTEARPALPSRLRSSGSASASSVSSGIASIRPAPKSGIGTRRATTLASGGSTGWQTWFGSENVWNSVLPVGVERPKRAVRIPVAGAKLGHRADAADGRHAVARPATRAVEGRPQPVVHAFRRR